MYKVKRLMCIVLALLLVCMIASCGKKNNVSAETETTEQPAPETTEFTFPDETGFYAHGGYSADNDPFGTEVTEPEQTETTATDPTEKDNSETQETEATTAPTEKNDSEDKKPEETTAPTESNNTQSGTSTVVTDYERYIAMSPAEQADSLLSEPRGLISLRYIPKGFIFLNKYTSKM